MAGSYIPEWKRQLLYRMHQRFKYFVAAGKYKRIERPSFLNDNRVPGVSNPAIGCWHKLMRVMKIMGYVKVNKRGDRDDGWKSMGPRQLAYYELEIRRLMKILLEAEEKHLRRVKDETFIKMENIWNETQLIIQAKKLGMTVAQLKEEFKPGLNNVVDDSDARRITIEEQKRLHEKWIGDLKMKFSAMTKWAEEVKDQFEGDRINWLRLNVGIHVLRVIPKGVVEGSDLHFSHFRQHSWGKGKNFRSCLCWDYVMDNPKGIRKTLIEKKWITKPDAVKAKEYGCPICATKEFLTKTLGLEFKEIDEMMSTRDRVIMNVYYVRQAYPEVRSDKTPKTGLYAWEMSPAMSKKIIDSMISEAAIDELDEDEAVQLISLDMGKTLAVQAEGEGIGKNKREYSVQFKGKKGGPISHRENPYDPNSPMIRLDPDEVPFYNLVDIEASKFVKYQQAIESVKAIFSNILDGAGYVIPGDEPSANPLDDNYDKAHADKTLGKTFKPGLKTDAEREQDAKNRAFLNAKAAEKAKKMKIEDGADDTDDPEDVPWEEEEKPKAKSKLKVVKTKPVEDDDEEEEKPKKVKKTPVERVIEEEEEEDAKAAKQVKKSPVAKVIEDDDDYLAAFGEGDDEEEEVKPKAKKASKQVEEEDDDWEAINRQRAANAKFNKAVPPSDEDEEEEEETPKKSSAKRKLY